LEKFIIMPNHIHGIVVIYNNVGAGLKPAPTYPMERYSLSEIIRGFKTFSSRKINKQNSHIHFRWQRSFYDHIIRNEQSLHDTRQYIKNNPLKWEFDRNHPDNP